MFHGLWGNLMLLKEYFFYDYETFYSTQHSVTKLDGVTYALHPDTEVMSMAYAINREPSVFIKGEENIRAFFASRDWSQTCMVAHNGSGFDHIFTGLKFKVRPLMWACTMAMAKPTYGKTTGCSLKALSEVLNVGKKLSFEAVNTKGKHLADLTPLELTMLEEYNHMDTRLCRAIFRKLYPDVPLKEMRLIDHTVRMLVEPMLEVDIPMLRSSLALEKARKDDAIRSLSNLLGGQYSDFDIMQKALQSNAQFIAILENFGVKAPTKISPSTGQQTYALAKTDQKFLDLLEHDHPTVRLAAETRLGTKSSILESRIERFIQVGEACDRKMPVFLNYFGALNSGRYSGGGKMNQQNLSRVDPANPKPSDVLRQCIKAPPGHKLVASDLSGIEMRVLHYLADVQSTMDAFKENPTADLYRIFGGTLYKCAPDEVTKPQRQLAKAAMLGLQYGAGATTFHRVASLQGVDMPLEEIRGVVNKWRDFYSEITGLWREGMSAILAMSIGGTREFGRHDLVSVNSAKKFQLDLPEGMVLRYPELRKEAIKDSEHTQEREAWVYGTGRNKAFIQGPKLIENIVQSMSRLFLTNAIDEIHKRYHVAMHVHDEIICIVPDGQAEECLFYMNQILRTPPPWFPDIVLHSEGHIGECYADVH